MFIVRQLSYSITCDEISQHTVYFKLGAVRQVKSRAALCGYRQYAETFPWILSLVNVGMNEKFSGGGVAPVRQKMRILDAASAPVT
jgi:hypothetical protein